MSRFWKSLVVAGTIMLTTACGGDETVLTDLKFVEMSEEEIQDDYYEATFETSRGEKIYVSVYRAYQKILSTRDLYDVTIKTDEMGYPDNNVVNIEPHRYKHFKTNEE